MSLYGDYLKEAFDMGYLEDETGFATFKIVKRECYVETVYIKPEHRSVSASGKIVDKVVEKAKELECNYLLTTINTTVKIPERSMMAILKYGFKFHSSDSDKIVFYKEI